MGYYAIPPADRITGLVLLKGTLTPFDKHREVEGYLICLVQVAVKG